MTPASGKDPRTASIPDDPAGIPEPHDTLAAEEFAMPAPEKRPGVVPPPDPAGIPEPHDTLAAEEFAMPAPVSDRRAGEDEPSGGDTSATGGRRRAAVVALGAAGTGLGLFLLRRARR